MDFKQEVWKERDSLLLEYHKLEAVDGILKERSAKIWRFQDVKALNEAVRREIRSQLRGGMLHRGIWRVERQSYRYFQVLLKKVEELCKQGVTLQSVERQLILYEKRIAARTSRGGTLTSIIQNEIRGCDPL